jgi:acyl carrier protein
MSIDETSVFVFVKATLLDIKDIDADDIQPDSPLDSIGLDSLDYVDIQLTIRKTYKLTLDPELFASKHITTIGELASHIVNETRVREAVSV